MYDYSKLKGRIVEVYGTQGGFAKAMNITKGTLSNKLRNMNYFKQDEIAEAIQLLDIDNPVPYFFTKQVEKSTL